MELVFESEFNLASKQLVIRVLVPNVEQHVVALDEELLALLVQLETRLFLSVDLLLAFFQALF